jgi:hypothetical protein
MLIEGQLVCYFRHVALAAFRTTFFADWRNSCPVHRWLKQIACELELM